jgi:high-affinity iron transporter
LVFREALEAVLITAIVLAYLARTKRKPLIRYVWYGVYLAVAASFALGAFIWFIYGGLSGSAKALFEGVAALFAVFVLSSMIYWMAGKGKELRKEVERRVKALVTRGATFALASFSFIVVFREGLETVLFLTPFLLDDVTGTLIGGFLGLVTALVLAYAIFVVGMKINIRRFFYFTSILLVLLAGGLAGYGVHELVEYSKDTGVGLGWLGEYAFNLGIPLESPFHHKGMIGSVFAVMFGYTVKAEWIRVVVHLAYLAIALPLVVWVYKKEDTGKDRSFQNPVSSSRVILLSFPDSS